MGLVEEDLIIPPVIWDYLRGGRLHASGNTAELSLLEFYLYTYDTGLDSTIGVFCTLVSTWGFEVVTSIGGFSHASGYI